MAKPKPLMYYTLMAAEGRVEDTIKFTQMTEVILNLNLAAALNRRGSPIKAVRNCAHAMIERMTHPQVKAILKNAANPVWTPDPVKFAAGMLLSAREAEASIRRQMIADGVISVLD